MRLEGRLALLAACLVLPGLVVAGVTNGVPLADSFEGDAAGADLGNPGTRGWVGDGAFVSNGTATASVPPGLPMADPHTKVLSVTDDLTLNVTNDTDTKIDFMVLPQLRDAAPTMDDTVQCAFYFDMDTKLNVWHGDLGGGTGKWTTTSATVTSGAWVRVSILLDYTSDGTWGDTYFQVRLNSCDTGVSDAEGYTAPDGTQVSTGPWFVCANSPGSLGGSGDYTLNSLGTQGECMLDDVVVTTGALACDTGSGPDAIVNVCTPVTGGSLSPNGAVSVVWEATQAVAATPDGGWAFSAFTWDGVEQAWASPVTVYNDDNVSHQPNLYPDDNGSILCAIFTYNGVPNTYYDDEGLTQGVPGDADPQSNEEEYVAGTDPNNAADYFQVVAIDYGGGSNTVYFSGDDDNIDTPFIMERTFDLVAGTWAQVGGGIARVSQGGTNVFVDVSPTDPAFYRPKAVMTY